MNAPDILDFDTAGDALPRPHGNCYWLVPGRLLAGEHPGATGAAALPARLAALRDAGISHFVDLTTTHDPVPAYAPLPAAGRPGMRSAHPIADFGIPDVATMLGIEGDIHAALAAGRAVYLHCRAGIGRTGTVAACLMVAAGYAPEQALALLHRKWQVVDKRDVEPRTPETEAQREFVRRWQVLREASR